MLTTTITGFPAYRLAAARHALELAHKRVVRSASRTGQNAPAAPELVVLCERVESKCDHCHALSRGFTGGCCVACHVGYLISREVVDLEIRAERPALAGWEFLAVVEPLDGGNLIRQVPGASVADGELAQWRTASACVCDHCRTARHRSETFIVRADGSDPQVPAGTRKQVGRNCLTAFLGGKSAAAIVAMLGWPEVVRQAGEEDGAGGCGSGPAVYDPEEFLGWVAGSIREDGWTSRTAAREGAGRRSTADHAQYLLTPQISDRGRWQEERERCAPGPSERERAAAALAWAMALPGATDYERNLALVARQTVLKPEHAGILASAIPTHTRALGREMERRARIAAGGEHVGEVGKRLELELTIERVVELATDWGAMSILVMRDSQGNTLVWKTGSAGGRPGDRLRLKGTVKAHSDYRGLPQTELTRCRILERMTGGVAAAA